MHMLMQVHMQTYVKGNLELIKVMFNIFKLKLIIKSTFVSVAHFNAKIEHIIIPNLWHSTKTSMLSEHILPANPETLGTYE